jgi:glycosyltransferase involved in cell wall biosynthesis
MADEQRAAQTLGLPWSTRLFAPGESAEGVLVGSGIQSGKRVRFKAAYYRWLARESRRYDVVLLRHSLSDPLQWQFIRRARVPVFTVHHTLEVPQIRRMKGPRAWVQAVTERAFGRMSIGAAAGVIAVTDEIARYETSRAPTPGSVFVYPNGISFGNGATGDQRGAGPPEVLFVASHFYDWHGLDLLLDSIRASQLDFRLHLVGVTTEGQTTIAAKDARIVMHGVLSSRDIEVLASRCWLGLSSFALDRKGMREACTLKVREYLRAGLPVYAGHPDVFDASMPYYRHGECSINRIIEFARQVRERSREEVARAAQPFIQKEALLQRLYEQLSMVIGD